MATSSSISVVTWATQDRAARRQFVEGGAFAERVAVAVQAAHDLAVAQSAWAERDAHQSAVIGKLPYHAPVGQFWDCQVSRSFEDPGGLERNSKESTAGGSQERQAGLAGLELSNGGLAVGHVPEHIDRERHCARGVSHRPGPHERESLLAGGVKPEAD